MNSEHIPVIAVDGPSGVGKGTLCVLLAKHLKWHLLDSGAIYRVLALSAIKQHVALENELELAILAKKLLLRFISDETGVQVMLDDENVSAQLRLQEIGDAASKIASLPKVREALLQRQRAFRTSPGLVADGRDMGTVVFPQATVKIFLDASPQARAERRMKQLQKKKICAIYDEILHEIITRDERDRNRAIAPLRSATDAFLIDSTDLSIDEVFKQALNIINSKININV
ncbi:(d)CMP kinase [Frischella sp. Ac48]|uniref:Cytidylate kinase n=1 Tax=Frischella japonica TaxID=2741544 RepID=A0ABR7QVU0_9GAMM|nr:MULTISPECIES: (d)CMP kinase [Frischella]MBC9130339.1 (d)CMP kinase [Frischella japonica]MBX4133328.1 (d)CMP kinase [Frischella sp. Ac48]